MIAAIPHVPECFDCLRKLPGGNGQRGYRPVPGVRLGELVTLCACCAKRPALEAPTAGDPAPAEIQAGCREIQAGWNRAEEVARQRGHCRPQSREPEQVRP